MSPLRSIYIGISACLTGESVRYDGAHKYLPAICNHLSKLFTLVPVCPEVAIGMGVPRQPIQLVGKPGSAHAVDRQTRTIDVTERLVEYAGHFLRENPGLSGLVMKARSPSCGVDTTPVYYRPGQQTATDSGIFSRTVRSIMPDVPLVDESCLGSRADMDLFVLKVSLYTAFRDQVLCAPDRQQALALFNRSIVEHFGVQVENTLAGPEISPPDEQDKLLSGYLQQLYRQVSVRHGDRQLAVKPGWSSNHLDPDALAALLAYMNRR